MYSRQNPAQQYILYAMAILLSIETLTGVLSPLSTAASIGILIVLAIDSLIALYSNSANLPEASQEAGRLATFSLMPFSDAFGMNLFSRDDCANWLLER